METNLFSLEQKELILNATEGTINATSREYTIHNRCFIGPLSTKEERANIQISIFPNPTQGEVLISIEDETFNSYTISSLRGDLISKENFIATKEFLVDTSQLVNGLYFISVQTEDQLIVKKLLVTH